MHKLGQVGELHEQVYVLLGLGTSQPFVVVAGDLGFAFDEFEYQLETEFEALIVVLLGGQHVPHLLQFVRERLGSFVSVACQGFAGERVVDSRRNIRGYYS
jgi:hypothetical protein